RRPSPSGGSVVRSTSVLVTGSSSQRVGKTQCYACPHIPQASPAVPRDPLRGTRVPPPPLARAAATSVATQSSDGLDRVGVRRESAQLLVVEAPDLVRALEFLVCVEDREPCHECRVGGGLRHVPELCHRAVERGVSLDVAVRHICPARLERPAK